MHRVDREYLKIQLSCALKRALPSVKDVMKPKRLPLETDRLCDTLARAIVDEIDHEGRMVIETERCDDKTHGGRRGVFGIDEPDPCV